MTEKQFQEASSIIIDIKNIKKDIAFIEDRRKKGKSVIMGTYHELGTQTLQSLNYGAIPLCDPKRLDRFMDFLKSELKMLEDKLKKI